MPCSQMQLRTRSKPRDGVTRLRGSPSPGLYPLPPLGEKGSRSPCSHPFVLGWVPLTSPKAKQGPIQQAGKELARNDVPGQPGLPFGIFAAEDY